MRIPNEGPGKSSWWVINHDVKPGKSTRRRAMSVDAGGGPSSSATTTAAAAAMVAKRRGRHRRSTSKGVIDTATAAASAGSPSPSPASLPLPPSHLAWSPSAVDELALSVSPSIGSPTPLNDALSPDSYSAVAGTSALGGAASAGYDFTPPPLETPLAAVHDSTAYVDPAAYAAAADFVVNSLQEQLTLSDAISGGGGGADAYSSMAPPPLLTNPYQSQAMSSSYGYVPSLTPISGSKATTPLGSPPIHRHASGGGMRLMSDGERYYQNSEQLSQSLPLHSSSYSRPPPPSHHHQHHQQHQHYQHNRHLPYGQMATAPRSSSWSQLYPQQHPQQQRQHPQHPQHPQGHYGGQSYVQPPPYYAQHPAVKNEYNQYGHSVDGQPLSSDCLHHQSGSYAVVGGGVGVGGGGGGDQVQSSGDRFPSDLDVTLFKGTFDGLTLDDVLAPEIFLGEQNEQQGGALSFDFDHFRDKDESKSSSWVH